MAGTNGKRPQGTPPVGKGNGHNPPKLRIDLRVEWVQSLVAAGETSANILRRVAEAAKKEAADRKVGLAKAAAFNESGQQEEAAKVQVPPVVWSGNADESDQPEGPAQRTVERYIHLAKLQLKALSAQTMKEGDLVMGMQLTRLNFLYVRCIEGKRYMDALEVAKEVSRLHGLHGAIRLELSGPQGKPIQTEDVTPLPRTEQQALQALRQLLGTGASRAGFNGQLPASAMLSATSDDAEEVDAEEIASDDDDDDTTTPEGADNG